MTTRAFRTHVTARTPVQPKVQKAAARTGGLPDMKTVKQRLDALTAADMPWLCKDVDLTPPDGGPEVCGPAVYRAPKQRR